MGNKTGNWNTGDYNTGNWNTGSCNTGDRNTGDYNIGDYNTGDWNTGDYNTGNGNTGHRNTGHRNTGRWNAGGWNTGNRNTGYCNSITPDNILVFNKPCNINDWNNAEKPQWMKVNLTKWVEKKQMTDKEKEANPSYVTTGGYLKYYSSLIAAYVSAWERTSYEDKLLTFKLPNYDEKVFQEVFGFTPKLSKEVKVVCNGKEVWISYESAQALNLIDK